jgi:hypothetical protein
MISDTRGLFDIQCSYWQVTGEGFRWGWLLGVSVKITWFRWRYGDSWGRQLKSPGCFLQNIFREEPETTAASILVLCNVVQRIQYEVSAIVPLHISELLNYTFLWESVTGSMILADSSVITVITNVVIDCCSEEFL